MADRNRVLELFSQLPASKMPVGYYVLSTDGYFLDCNKRAREILGMPLEGDLGRSIVDFHQNPNERKDLLRKAEEEDKKGNFFEGIIRLWIDGREKYIRESICAIHEQNTKEIVGYYGYIIDITNEHWYYHLFNHLPIGVYRLNQNDVVVDANDEFAHILGYDTSKSVIGEQAIKFYVDQEAEDKFREEIIQAKGNVVKEILELVRRNGELFFAKVSSRAIMSNCSYQGREGTVFDVTTEEYYRRSLDDVPVGYYRVRRENGKDLIRHWNQQFMDMFKFSDKSQIDGYDITKLYAYSDDYPKFLSAMQEMAVQGKPLNAYKLNVKRIDDQTFFIEVHSRYIYDRKGNITGRTGVVFDITKETQLQEQIKMLQGDIGRVLHSYTTTLLTARHQILVAIEAMAPSPFKTGKYPLDEDVDKETQKKVGSLLHFMNNFISAIGRDWQERGIPVEEWSKLISFYEILLGYKNYIPQLQFQEHTLRLTAHTLLKVCEQLKPHKVPREILKDIIANAKTLESTLCLAGLHRIEADIIAMDHEANVLRDVVTGSTREEELENVVPIWRLVERAMNNLNEFAYAKNVILKPNDRLHGALIKVNERNVVRALGNLLHNAIKYSWIREQGKSAWIDISSYRRDGKVCIEFENYGVPIPKDEIDNKLIFILGYRGRRSGDRGRIGTGIGLADALQTAKNSGGDIIVISNPASPGKPEDDYNQPFLTKVTLALPEYGKKEEHHK